MLCSWLSPFTKKDTDTKISKLYIKKIVDIRYTIMVCIENNCYLTRDLKITCYSRLC